MRRRADIEVSTVQMGDNSVRIVIKNLKCKKVRFRDKQRNKAKSGPDIDRITMGVIMK